MRATHLGPRISSLRRQVGLTQKALADRLGISPSYLNLLEHDRRPISAALLLAVSRSLDVDLRTLADDSDGQLLADLAEVFADPVFEGHPLSEEMVRELVTASPTAARAVVRLHQAYTSVRTTAETLESRLLDDTEVTLASVQRARLASERVSDFMHRHSNHFPELEAAAEREWRDGRFSASNLFGSLVQRLKRTHGVAVRMKPIRQMGAVVRRFDGEQAELRLSEALPPPSRSFQIAVQLALLSHSELLDGIIGSGSELDTDETRKTCRIALANYFAGAILMPYQPFRDAAEAERYDIELLENRFCVGWEQACHRLTTLRRSGAEGVPFYCLRMDRAGNISKRFNAAGVHFPRFSGLCALWNVHGAFAQPGRVLVQLGRFPDGSTVLAVARTVHSYATGFHAPDVLYSVGVGCHVSEARRVVYADGLDLENEDAADPIGMTCRTCERATCKARAFPAIHRLVHVNENVRSLAFFPPER